MELTTKEIGTLEEDGIHYTFDAALAAELGLSARLYSTWRRIENRPGNQRKVSDETVYTYTRAGFDRLMAHWNRSNPSMWLYCHRS